MNNYLSPKQKEQKAIAETKCNQGNIEACGEVLKWNKLDKEQSFAGVFIDDIVQGIVGGANGLHTIMTLDSTKLNGGLVAEGLYGMITLKMGAGNGSAIGYELPFPTPLYYPVRFYPYTNPLILDTDYTIGSGQMFSIQPLLQNDSNWLAEAASFGGAK